MPPDAPVLIEDAAAWRTWLCRQRFDWSAPATAKAVVLVRPDGFALAAESQTDNAYMASGAVDSAAALREHAALVGALAGTLAVTVFPGDAETPDAVFPNNAFASVPGKLIVGAMRHPVRQRETWRRDIPNWFRSRHGCAIERLDQAGVIAELTGVLVIDHLRNLGYCGLSERVNPAGAAALQRAFGLRGMFVFALHEGEYHSNVVLSVLAGRALVLHAGAFVDAAVPAAIAALYAPHVLWLSAAEKDAFCGNCIALANDQVWLSTRAAAALQPDHRQQLQTAGFALHTVALDEIEKAGGSLRCCVCEVW